MREEGVKGSARSIEEYNMFEGLLACKELLDKFHDVYDDPEKEYSEEEWLHVSRVLCIPDKSIDQEYIGGSLATFSRSDKERKMKIDMLQEQLIEKNNTADVRVIKLYHDLIQMARNEMSKISAAESGEEVPER